MFISTRSPQLAAQLLARTVLASCLSLTLATGCGDSSAPLDDGSDESNSVDESDGADDADGADDSDGADSSDESGESERRDASNRPPGSTSRSDVSTQGARDASQGDSGAPLERGDTDAGRPASDAGDAESNPRADGGDSAPTNADQPSCASLPPAADYGAKGPFADAKMIENTGPGGAYTLFRPDASLGQDGFKHPIATWGNGIVTTPPLYEELLTTIASHGFVIIAANTTMAERPALSDGLDWLIAQNGADGALQGKLDTSREVTIGYSWGGGAAIDTANRPNVVATVSFHGMPPRGASAFADMHSPLLLFTSTGDTFVSASGYVTPNYEKSTVQTFYATLDDSAADHLYVLGDAGKLRAPAIAWLRMWTCDDMQARAFFYGDDCTLCSAPWTMPRRKNWPAQ